ncbi:MAG TPA: hypothetical protein VEX86_09835 [Longimicrobium sp.]|nr:hypothetical protein [Longimicrobium sp.]
MKLSALAVAALLVIPAHQAVAQGHDHGETRIEIGDDGGHIARPGPRHSLRDAHLAITTTNDVASLVLTRGVVALQLTDRTLREIRADVDRDTRDNDGIFASMISSVVRNTVGTVLRRSLEVPIRDLRTVDYRGGRLVFVTEDGDRLFEDTEVNGTDLTASFSARDAQAFVREFRALKARTR